MTALRTLPALLRLARPYQWTKNGFVLAGLLFGHAWSQPDTLRAVLWMFASFCLASSAVYVLNDLADLEADRRHPESACGHWPAGRWRAMSRCCGRCCWRWLPVHWQRWLRKPVWRWCWRICF